MREATNGEVERIAHDIAEDVVTPHLREFLETNVPETAYLTKATFIDGEHVELTDEQEALLVEAAVIGLVRGLREFDADDSP